ncbi:hypothetical protein F4778DRAFT_736175 [Xylariomycetidae sp. FL2044]|nr:hypothetical protein F4778DRAFT_736175 [Xylariomycetidae sp. FL2044]
MQRRRVGLSYTQKPRRLLSYIEGRPHEKTIGPRPQKREPLATMSEKLRNEEPDPIHKSPDSTDDEESNLELAKINKDHPVESDDENDRSRGHIKSTFFSRKPTSTQPEKTGKGLRSEAKSSPETRRPVKASDDEDEPSSSAGSKRSAGQHAHGTGSHLTDLNGFTRPSKKPKVGYGKSSQGRSSQPRSSQNRSSQKYGPRSSQKNGHKGANEELMDKKLGSSPTSGGKTFKFHEADLSSEPGTPRKGWKPTDDMNSSPEKKNGFRPIGTISEENSPEKTAMKLYNLDDSARSASRTSSAQSLSSAKNQKRGKIRAPRGKPRDRNALPEQVAEDCSQKPSFKTHHLDDLDELQDSDLDELLPKGTIQIGTEIADDLDVFEREESPSTPRCPMCHEEVDAELLKKHLDHGRMNIRKQTAFCRLHKKKTAANSGSKRGYPEIDWENLETRIQKHQGLLKQILEQTKPSHYRELLKEKVQTGKNRTLLKTGDSLTPGYYGPRGLRFMTEYILRTLSSVVRQRAIQDRLISARGYTGYVQAVLVPELTVRLIMEDMSVAEKEAREIMQNSIEVGELLYEDAGDIITNVSDEDEI